MPRRGSRLAGRSFGAVLAVLVAGPVPAAAGVAVDCLDPAAPRAPLAAGDAPEAFVVPAAVPNDPDLALLWPYATDAGPAAPPRPGDLRAQDAWALATGVGVRVAVVDTGLDPLAADVEPAVLRNPGELANGLDDDGNGLVDDVRGWDFVTDSPDAGDVHPDGHGTQVAGIVAARAGNGLQAAGLAPGAELVPIRALGPTSGLASDIAAGLTYAIAQYDVRIVNLSLSGETFSETLARALCSHPDVLFVAAAGNGARDVDLAPTYPCAYALPNVVCVGATDRRDRLAAFSNRGAGTVELAAPGVGIVSTGLGGALATSTGTSQSAAMVSAAAAMVLERAGALTATELKDVLLRSAERLPALFGTVAGGRRLDAGRAVAAVSPPVFRDVRVVVRDGVPAVQGTLVTEGPTATYLRVDGPAGPVGRAARRRVDDTVVVEVPLPARVAGRPVRLVAQNARGRTESVALTPPAPAASGPRLVETASAVGSAP